MFYVATAHKTDSVASCLAAHFTSPVDLNLILNKFTHLEIHLMTEALELVLDVDVYARIATVDVFRPKVE